MASTHILRVGEHGSSPGMTGHRVLIIEDQPETRERLARIIAATPGLELAAALPDFATGCVWLAAGAPPMVMLVDLGLPDGDGLELIRMSRLLDPQPEVMVISVFGDEQHVLAAIEAGATGYLLKDGSADEIGSAVLRLINGESPISSSIARHLLRRLQPGESRVAAAEAPRLTQREAEVLRLVAKGFSYAEIAGGLGMSAHTVTSHIKHIYRKLEVRSRGEAVFEAMQLGILDAPR
jgi:DNA-binding NarL/FixJ family response regulator